VAKELSMSTTDFISNQQDYFNIIKYCLGPLFGAFAGSYITYRFAIRRENINLGKEKIRAAQESLFILSYQVNVIAVFKKQIFNKYEGNPLRHYLIPPILSPDHSELKINPLSISFLLFTSHKNYLGKTIAASDYFHSIINTIESRTSSHLEFQKLLEKHNLISFDNIETKKIIGERLCISLERITNEIYEMFDLYIADTTALILQLAENFEEIFPKNKFIRFTLE
jgi:hypothetical protein